MYKNKLALNLSKTSIQLLKRGSKKTWNVLGSVDPSSKNLEKDLVSLRNQAAALSTKKPIVDVLLPRELVLSQTIVIEDNFSIEYCKKVTAKRCGLNENELLIAVGDSSTRSTVPIAAISANSITESRNFVKRAGFRPERYIASSKISGFKKSPVFFNDNSSKRLFDFEGQTFTQALSIISFLLFAGFLLSLTSTFLEYRTNNKPYNYLADSRKFGDKENNLKPELSLLGKAKEISSTRLDILTFEIKDPNLIDLPQEPKNRLPKVYSFNKFSVKSQFNANQKIVQLKGLKIGELNNPISIPENPIQSDDFKEFAKLQKVALLSSSANKQKKLHGSPPMIDKNFSYSKYLEEKSSIPSKTISNSLKMKMVFDAPKKESSVNHEYKKVAIEEVFSDLSLTKILITTANSRASTLPLIFFDIKKPNILSPNKMIGFDFKNNENKAMIRPKNITQEEFFVSILKPTYRNELILNHQLNVKLKEQGIDVKLLQRNQEKDTRQLTSWNGKRPTIKPHIIDSIKVLDDPTKSTGAVTFVDIPPGMPTVVSELKKVAASSIRNLKVRSNPPSIPRRSSIVGNSTLRNLIELNRTNLIGVFGKRTGRIALIRLSSGNTVKVKVGQQFGNGWRVISIDLDKIHITNGTRQETLRIPG
jgi:hypothetical protein